MRAASWWSVRTEGDTLRMLVVITALLWSLVFIALALRCRLQIYADGAMFSYAVAVRDVWAFHWHNISGRLTVFILSLWPAELFVKLSGNPRGAITVYGFLFYIAPLLGLAATFAADRSRGRIIFVYACCSTALLCPLVFGFPTEMWMAHAFFWPSLALSHYARRSLMGVGLLSITTAGLIFSHEGALVLALTITLTLALRGWRNSFFIRSVAVLSAVLLLWAVIKIMYPPDRYFGDVLIRAAVHFFDPTIFEANLVVLLLAVLGLYAAVFLLLSRFTGHVAFPTATVIVSAVLVIYWLWFDHWIHASNRYYMRTLLVVITPVFGFAAAFYAQRADRLISLSPSLARTATIFASEAAMRAILGAFILITLVHVVQTGKFIADWTAYKNAVRMLAAGNESDPALGDPRFVSAQRIAPDLKQLTWFSTVEYLSILVTDFKPNRLVIDPRGNYFWLSCATATASAKATRAVPVAARELVRVYSCLHR